MLVAMALLALVVGSGAAGTLQDALSTAASGSPVASAAAAAAAAPPGDAGDCQPGEVDQPMQLLHGEGAVELTTHGRRARSAVAGERPNILLIVTDDQGYDDIGMHNPAWVNTPHLDAFMRAGTRFDNFYTAPQCAQTRAELLTGRNHARTGVLLVHAGYDFVSRDEVTGAELLRRAGYKTAHFGKFHNHNIDGYMPWQIGYDDAWIPGLTSANASILTHNGQFDEQGRGMPDDAIADKLVSYIATAAANTTAQPFFATFATHGMHLSNFPLTRALRPPRRRQVFAMANYLDSVLGKVLRTLDDTGLAKRTLVLVLGDNGSSLTDSQRNNARERAARMPSKMVGEKDWVWEGGVRGWLAARGPGVPVGAVDSTLLYTPDIVPTLLDLARARSPASGPNLPAFDGKSFAAHLRPASAVQHAAPPAGRFDARTLFFLSPHCWDADAVPQLGPDRRVLRPQPLLDFDTGGVVNAHESEYMMLVKQQRGGAPPGFARCIAVRHKDFKLQGHDGKVYRLPGASRVELGCNEVTGPLRARLTAELGAAARAWWAGLVEGADSHAFAKPVFNLGSDDVLGTSILAPGAHERTPQSIVLLPNGARGFVDPGDRMCWAVTVRARARGPCGPAAGRPPARGARGTTAAAAATQVSKAGTYSFSALHLSAAAARFRLSLGTFAAIVDGSAQAVEAKLPHTTVVNGTELGQLELQPTAGPVDLCLELVTTTSPGRPMLKFFGALQAYRMKVEAPSGGLAHSVAAGAAVDSAAADGAAVDSAAVDTASAAAWVALRRANGVPDGQPELLGANMYSPYDAEGIDACDACKPPV
ncbi:sulfatase [Scenedesmus sp. PABB004]|nr:sulfatase [Scenedesmus sp. PABB004]